MERDGFAQIQSGLAALNFSTLRGLFRGYFLTGANFLPTKNHGKSFLSEACSRPRLIAGASGSVVFEEATTSKDIFLRLEGREVAGSRISLRK